MKVSRRELSSGSPGRALLAKTLALSLSLGACTDPPKPVVPAAAAADSSRSAELQEATNLEAAARGLPPGKTAEAVRMAYRALEIRRRLLGDGHIDTWRTAELIADLHLRANQLDEAESALQFDLAARERALGAASAQLAEPLGRLADVAVRRRNYPAAEQLRRRALSVLESGLGPWHPDVALGGSRLASLLLDLCRTAEAKPLLQRTLEIQERALGPTSPDLASGWARLAEAHWRANEDTAAESSLQKAIALLSGHEKERGETLIDALDRLADMYHERKLTAETVATRERAVDVGGRFLGTSHASTLLAVSSLWDLYRSTGSPDAGDKLLSRLAVVRIERVRPGATAPASTPAPKATARCVSPAVPSTGTVAQGGSVANASAVVASMASGFRRCYNSGLKVDANLRGSVRVTARIGAQGEVTSASTFVPAGLMATVGECVVDVALQSQFAPPDGGGAVIVIPVTFVSQ